LPYAIAVQKTPAAPAIVGNVRPKKGEHELGHAALHNRRARRNFGNQESEADSFAAVILILSSRNDADLVNMLVGVKYFPEVFRQQGLTLDALTDEHELSERRYYAFACLAAGANANVAGSFYRLLSLQRLRSGNARLIGVTVRKQ